MGGVLNADQRRHLESAIQRARTASEQAAADALRALAVAEPSRPSYLTDDSNSLRLALREKARQLGDDTAITGADLTNLIREVAYEQWHRLLFARFLELNGLLRHPEFRDTALSLGDCGDLADDLGEPDGWSVAARYASEILPGVFRLNDPAAQVRFATEHRLELEGILLSVPPEIFVTEDALGWVYQFWQTAEKKRVQNLGVKIGGADLSPVTQLFTENYMVRFMLENSLGAWWTAHNPDSPLVAGWKYLRRLDDGTPAAGTFDEWPKTAAELTVMDPCCGSGHFLVAMFGMLWKMRAEAEGLTAAEAQDAVIRDNIHGLELDPRCTQIAMFNIALEAWKQGGFRDLPAPQIACSGIPARGALEQWESRARGDDELRKVLRRLHNVYRDADSLGSLIAPMPSDLDETLIGRDLSVGVRWDSVRESLTAIIDSEHSGQTVLGHAAADVVHSAILLAGRYTLVATNPPYLTGQNQTELLRNYLESSYPEGKADLSTAFLLRCRDLCARGGTAVLVVQQAWLFLPTYKALRSRVLAHNRLELIARLGEKAFSSSSASGAFVCLVALSATPPDDDDTFMFISADDLDLAQKEIALYGGPLATLRQKDQLGNPDQRIGDIPRSNHPLLSAFADSYYGLGTGDYGQFGRFFWEVPALDHRWILQQGAPRSSSLFEGRSNALLWEGGRGRLSKDPWRRQARIGNVDVWGKNGVVVGQTRQLSATLYTGESWDSNCAVIIPKRPEDLAAIWCYCRDPEYSKNVRKIDSGLKVMNVTLLKVPFDAERWRTVAAAEYPNGLPLPSSSDPTQWVFNGDPRASEHPLLVGVARLLGYRWPGQQSDPLERLADSDGIAALQTLPGESDLATRLRELLLAAYGIDWSSTLERALVIEAGGLNGRLEDWLRDKFFANHAKVFENRPFLWHIWDGRKDGYSAVVNYHRLDHRTLEKLTFASLGAWIERQKHENAAGRAGADARLAAAENLQGRLKLILDGVPPFDVYVRWKELRQQPICWDPDLDDGVRLNIRPFVVAGVLRSKVNINWNKDRGRDPQGYERVNDLHPTLEERRIARLQPGAEL